MWSLLLKTTYKIMLTLTSTLTFCHFVCVGFECFPSWSFRQIPILILILGRKNSKGRERLPNQLNFRKKSNSLRPPTLIFRKLYCNFFLKKRLMIVLYNIKVQNQQDIFLDWKLPNPPFGTFTKIHPIWWRDPSRGTMFVFDLLQSTILLSFDRVRYILHSAVCVWRVVTVDTQCEEKQQANSRPPFEECQRRGNSSPW